ncbi:cell surface glycoprotein CD200 receptor 1-B-like isoform X1 [Mixophyes fleayi]|uniref:cell surface glycoprotein CD200 receptor 1-B-like isoform X1 n=1 Tax=Mixophyes fleayi TaxID=3061075 RepID=UPI003F4D8A77
MTRSVEGCVCFIFKLLVAFVIQFPVTVGFVMSARISSSVVLQCEGDVTHTMVALIWKIHLLNNYKCLFSSYNLNDSLYNNCSARIKYSDLSLTIDSAQISDGGNYRCETATAYSGTFINVTTLQVFSEPSVTLELNSEGSPECRAIGGYPAAEISWIPHSHDITTTSAENPDQTWTVISTYCEKRDNVTSVTCVVSHPTFMYSQEKSISVPGRYNYIYVRYIWWLRIVVFATLLLTLGFFHLWKYQCCTQSPVDTSAVRDTDPQETRVSEEDTESQDNKSHC